jgi:site-specific DNA recombinase
LIDVLLVYRVDRFSRNLRDTVTLLSELDEAGGAFRSATEPFDTSTAMGRMTVQLLAMFAQFERDMIVDRVTAGMERKAANGQWKGGPPPPGYDVDPATDKLTINETEAVLIKLIFDLYAKDRLGSRTITHTLNDRGYRTRSGALWAFKRILTILENRVCLGEIHYRDVITKNAHPGIIEPEQFEEAQRLLDQRGGNHSTRAASGSDYMATGKTKTYRYYTCMKRSKYGTKARDMDRVNADALDQSRTGRHRRLLRHPTQPHPRRGRGREEGLRLQPRGCDRRARGRAQRTDPGHREDRQIPRRLRGRTPGRTGERTHHARRGHTRGGRPAHHPDHLRGQPQPTKAIVENFVVQIKITGPGRIVPVFRVPQPAGATNAEGAESGLPASAPEGVRACSSLVDLTTQHENSLVAAQGPELLIRTVGPRGGS